jgi:hypothetical protein
LEPLEFADLLYSFGWLFSDGSRPALIACEVQPSGGGGGQTVVARLRERGYSNLYRYEQPGSATRKRMSMFGMPTTKSTKPLMVNTLAEWLTPDELTGELRLHGIPPILRDELGTFVVKPNGTVAADIGAHDDHVIAIAIAMYVLSTAVRGPATKAEKVETSMREPGVVTYDLSGIRQDIAKHMEAGAKRQRRDAAKFQRKLRKHYRR